MITIASKVVKDNKVMTYAIVLMLSYVPNVLLFFVGCCSGSAVIRKIYFYFLQFKLLVFAFMVPLIIISMVSSRNVAMYDAVCGGAEDIFEVSCFHR